MLRRLLRNVPLALALAGLALLVATLAVWLATRSTGRQAAPPPATTTAPAPPSTAATTTTPATTTPATTPAAPVPPTRVPMSWNAAGGLVWHTGDVDPALLGRALRQAGFGWI